MFDGDLWIEGSPLLSNLVFLLGFFTLILTAAQEDGIIIPALDIFHTFISWPSFNEGTVLTVCLWCFRNVERILGFKVFLQFLLYNLLVYIPIFIMVVFLKGFIYHFSFFYFAPFSLFIFVLWEIPPVKVFFFITDKITISVLFIVVTFSHFPYSLLPLVSAILGNVLWSYDLFRMRKCTEEPIDVDDTINDIHLGDLENITENNVNTNNVREATSIDDNTDNNVDDDAIKSMTDMGFSREQALSALAANGNNVQKAVDSLLAH